MRFVTRAACAILLTLGAYVSIGCGDDGTEPAKDNPSPTWRHLWSKRFGDASSQFARAVAVDTLGNSIVTGYFYGAVDFGGGALTSEGAYDIFLAKLAPTGAHVWSKRFGDASEQTVQGVAVDQAGNVYIAGYFEGTVDFGGGALTSAGLRDVFVAKFEPDGSCIWSKRFGDTNYQAANALALDSFGNVVIAGGLMGTVDFGGGALTSAGGWDIFAAKLDPGGNHVWSKRFGDGLNQYATAVAGDGSGNAFVAGYFRGAMDFGGGNTLTSAGEEDIFIAKFASGGGYEWSKRFGDASTDQQAWGVAVDGFDNAIVVGHFTGAVDFGGGALPNAGSNTDIFVAKFGSDGAHVWSKSFGDIYAQSASAVAVDPSDNVLVTGGFYMTVDFGGGTLTSSGYEDAYLAKLSPGGAHIWSKCFGDADFQDAQAVTTDVSGNAFIAGYFSGGTNFGGGTLVSAGGEDIFLAKFGL
jgi:hypothetical protein